LAHGNSQEFWEIKSPEVLAGMPELFKERGRALAAGIRLVARKRRTKEWEEKKQ